MYAEHRNGECVDMYVECEGYVVNADDQDIWVGDQESEDEEIEGGEDKEEIGDDEKGDVLADDEGGEDKEEDREEAVFTAGTDAEYFGDQGTPPRLCDGKVNADILKSPMINDKDFLSYMAFYKSPTKDSEKKKTDISGDDEVQSVHAGSEDENLSKSSCSGGELSDDSSDEDYMQPLEDDSSAEDDEAVELRKHAKKIKRDIKANKLGIHGSCIVDIRAEDLVDEVPDLDEPGSPVLDSSDEYSYEENNDGETERWKSLENRYDSKAKLPVFSLGMAFRGSRQFKKALVKYGIKEHKSLKFPKDEKDRVRVICDWPNCMQLVDLWIKDQQI